MSGLEAVKAQDSSVAEIDTTAAYKKRVLDRKQLSILSSYYAQDGDNAAVSGGLGSEKLTDVHTTFVLAAPLTDDDVLTVEFGISAYTSASSSNIDPFDEGEGDPFQASSGASSSDTWLNAVGAFAHSSADRNNIWSANASFANEFDYTSFGFGGSFTRLLNEKNTQLSIKANVLLDTWLLVYPVELRPFNGGDGLADPFFSQHILSGNAQYAPLFKPITDKARNSFSMGLGYTQVLSQRLQGSMSLDLVQQQGLLSTPFQRVYLADVENTYIGHFQLGDDIERLPGTRMKIAVGGRLHFYVNEHLVLRGFYRYYTDDWRVNSHTASLTLPIKIGGAFTFLPSYRYYNQSASQYFAPYEQNLSSSAFYTSDNDLSAFAANQVGFGVEYKDIFTRAQLFGWGFQDISVKYDMYQRDTGFKASIFSFGVNMVDMPRRGR